MSWIDEDQNELRRNREWAAEQDARNQLIANDAEAVYNNLWDELVARIAEAQKKGLPRLITNGLPFERKIIVPITPKATERYAPAMEVTVQLARTKLAVLITGGHEPISLALDRGDDDVTGLKYNGEYQSIGDAAKLILRPLLFPDLFHQA